MAVERAKPWWKRLAAGQNRAAAVIKELPALLVAATLSAAPSMPSSS